MTLMTGKRRDVNIMSMRRMIIIAGMIWLGLLQVPCGAEKIVLRLKSDEVRQEIDGFGASGALPALCTFGKFDGEYDRQSMPNQPVAAESNSFRPPRHRT